MPQLLTRAGATVAPGQLPRRPPGSRSDVWAAMNLRMDQPAEPQRRQGPTFPGHYPRSRKVKSGTCQITPNLTLDFATFARTRQHLPDLHKQAEDYELQLP